MGGRKETKHVQIQEPKSYEKYLLQNGHGFQRAKSFVLPGQLQAQKNKELAQQRRRSGVFSYPRAKPTMELYRPPTIRNSGLHENGSESAMYCGKNLAYDSHYALNKDQFNQVAKRKSGLNINAKEFLPDTWGGPLQPSKTGNFLKINNGHSLDYHHPYENKEKYNDSKVKFKVEPKVERFPTGFNSIQRSKSLGSADLLKFLGGPLNGKKFNLDAFPPEAQKLVSSALNEPDELSARQLIDVVQQIFHHVLQSSRNAEPTARLCTEIIENDESETFLETLLNSCQEYYREREKLLRTPPTSNSNSRGAPNSYPRWVAYLSFINELYSQLKRHHSHLMVPKTKNDGTPPVLLLLTLISQCCYASLQKAYVNSMSEIECLFFVLSTVGKDLENKVPQQMEVVISAVRDAFLSVAKHPAVKKTLLQLIEMHAAKWQLPASAVMYYYPGSSAKLANGVI